LLSLFVTAGYDHEAPTSFYKFAENKGQWGDSILFKADIPAGNLYLEATSLVYVFKNEEDMARLHLIHHGEIAQPKPEDFLLRGHCMKFNFIGANKNSQVSREGEAPDYLNYYLGNDPSRWQSNIRQYYALKYNDLYNGIDLHLYSVNNQLKYDLIVSEGISTQQIALEYEGAEETYLLKGNLHIKTSVNELIEQRPYAYQLIDNQQVEVPCNFSLNQGIIGFDFPNDYDHAYPLFIDPVLIFSSFSGSGKDNWGYTATYDESGNLYGGGIVFESFGGSFSGNYPRVGAFQTTFGGGTAGAFVSGIDMGISKFSSDGTSLLYSTYLGGVGNEAPHSLVVNSNNELIVFGTSSSSNYPTTVGAFDRTFNGGPATTANNGSIDFSNGTDIVVTKFNALGSALIASTYIGGTGNDGLNISSGALVKNYGDDFRGEVYTDASNNIYVASATHSNTDFPTSNAIQPFFGGGTQDGCAFKLNANMSSLLWSTYLGGSNEDAAFSIQLDLSGNALVAGGTSSPNFPTTAGALHQGPLGGVDGFISKISALGDSLIASTYTGTANYDQNYFVQLDGGDSIYVVGQTEGNYPVFPSGVFTQPNGGQYIHKLTPGLDSTVFSMRFGTNRFNQVDIALSAFLVNDCDHIYVSGWGGGANTSSSFVPGSTTNGLTTTTGAHKTTTDGRDFYLIALAENADSIIYATFFGGTGISGEHADGGTSRFDKKGIVYQAVCAGCSGGNFPTTTGVWSTTNGSPNCNLGVIKFDLSKPFSDIQLSSPPYVCVPGSIQFGNNSRGTDFFWDFGDGTTSTDFEPLHLYNDTGTFEVMLVVSDSALCVTTDTSYITIRGVPPPEAIVAAVAPICQGSTVQLTSSGGTSRKWFPPTGLSSDTVANPIASPDTSTTYRLIVLDSCNADTAFVFVEVYQDDTYVMDDTSICLGNDIVLEAGGGLNYLWAPATALNDPSLKNPTAKPMFTTSYVVTIEDENSCVWKDTVVIEVDPDVPEANATGDTTICAGGSAQLMASGGILFDWQPTLGLDKNNISNPTATPQESVIYTVHVTNACGTVSDQVEVKVNRLELLSIGDSIACIGKPARLIVAGADFYQWEPAVFLDKNDVSNPRATINEPTLFTVHASDNFGCEKDTTILLGLRKSPFLNAGPDLILEWGKSQVLQPLGKGDFYWQPPVGLSCERCKTPVARPEKTTTYFLRLTDEYGCVSQDSLTIYVSGSIYVPNAFTPNGDGNNDYFKAITTELRSFELQIYNRWGELVYQSTSLNAQWDGTENGKQSPVATYVWQIKYVENSGKEGEQVGLVNLIR
jgi:gliding motility-associated-like protein